MPLFQKLSAWALGLAPLALIATLSASASQWTWTGDTNNNWDANANWSGTPGFPDGVTDDVLFPRSPSRFDIDLRGGDRDVRHISFEDLGGNTYSFQSNTDGQGTLRINGDVTVGALSTNARIQFASSIDVVVAEDSTWNLGLLPRVVFNSSLRGNKRIDLTRSDLRLNASNPFSGNLVLGSQGGG